jgi:hypothetical protein
LKENKQTSIDVSESRKFLEVETVDKETLMESSETKYQCITTIKFLLVKDHLEIEFKKQFNEKSTYTNSLMVKGPSIATN